MQTVAGYEILGELGRGGMGVVYKARQERLKRLTALKMIIGGGHAGEKQRERFRREAEAVAALQHPNIVQIYDVGQSDGYPYLALEYIEGGTLAGQIDGEAWPARRAAEMGRVLAETVQHAHDHGVVHRDLKPQNILLTAGGAPKVTDFGLAKRFTPETDSDITGSYYGSGPTGTGAIIGTPSYLAPEQASGKNVEVGPAVDVYSLGAILYELLTGRPPFRGATPTDTLMQAINDEPREARSLNPAVPRTLNLIVMKCLEKEPLRRYATARDLADDLDAFLHGRPIAARPTSVMSMSWKMTRRHPLVAVGAAVALIFLSVTAVVYYNYSHLLKDTNGQLEMARRKAVRLREVSEQRRIEAEIERGRARAQARRAAGAMRAARRLAEEAHRATYAMQLTQIAAMAEHDPVRASRLLLDPDRCPPPMRSFAWEYLVRLTSGGRRSLAGHAGEVTAVAYSPNGKLLASGGWDKSVRMWDAVSGECVATLTGPDAEVTAVAFAPGGSHVAAASADGTVRLWPIPKDGKPPAAPAVLPAHKGCVRDLAFSPNGRRLATAGEDGLVKLWATPRHGTEGVKLHKTIAGHRGGLWAVAFSPDGRTVASAGTGGEVRLTPLDESAAPEVWATGKSAVAGLAFSLDGRSLAVVTRSHTHNVQLWDVDSGTRRGELRGHAHQVHDVVFSPDGRWLATCGADRTVRVWRADSGRQWSLLVGHDGLVRGLAFSPDGRQLASASYDKTVRLWDLQRAESATVNLPDAEKLEAAAATADGSLFTARPDGTVKRWALDGERVRERASFTLGDRLDQIAVEGAGRWLAAADEDGEVRVWDLNEPGNNPTARDLGNPASGDPLKRLAFTPDGRWLVAAVRNILVMWKTSDWSVRKMSVGVERPVDSWAVSDQGQVAVAAGGRLSFTGLDGGPAIGFDRPQTDPVTALVWSPGGDTLALGDTSGDIEVWRNVTSRPRLTGRVEGQEDPVRRLTFADGGKTLLSAGERQVRLHDPLTAQERIVLLGHGDTILEAGIHRTGGGPVLLSLSRDGEARIWSGETPRREG